MPLVHFLVVGAHGEPRQRIIGRHSDGDIDAVTLEVEGDILLSREDPVDLPA